MTTLENKAILSNNILITEVDNEAVLLNKATGKYFTLDEVGTRIWKLIAQHGQLQPVYQAMLDEYNVEPQQLEQDMLALVDNLRSSGLLQIDVA
jgi:hypothetical protein